MAERIDRALGVLALAVVATGVVGWRSLRRVQDAVPGSSQAAVPSPQLRQLIPFAAPLNESQLTIRSSADTVALRRDPFTGGVPERVVEAPASEAVAPRPATTDSTQWHVTATLISSTRRAAIINDVLTYVGDRVPGGGKLLSVESDRVVLTDSRGATHTVKADKEGT